jgi:D-lactate dehydrogenase (cytochrome)
MTSQIIAMGGTCTGEHGVGAGKIDSLVEEAGEASVAVMRAIKATLDPHGILNPGKIFN